MGDRKQRNTYMYNMTGMKSTMKTKKKEKRKKPGKGREISGAGGGGEKGILEERSLRGSTI